MPVIPHPLNLLDKALNIPVRLFFSPPLLRIIPNLKKTLSRGSINLNCHASVS